MFSAAEEKTFLQWMRDTNQMFTANEYQLRLGIWQQNARFVREHNKANKDFKLTMNHLAALTPNEYRSLLTFKSIPRNHVSAAPVKSVPNDDAVDWRDKGVVNEVKDQAQCGSCWSFSAIQAVESQWAIVKGELLSLSEQNLVDCATKDYECEGCNGGLNDGALRFAIEQQAGGFMLESDYPYKGRDQDCKFDASKVKVTISKCNGVAVGSETDLADKCKNYGPISIAIDASHLSFQLYFHGIYNEKRCSSTELDHAVGCVGYGAEDDKKYWIVRNSWGKHWGEQGYIRMIKDENNQCGEATSAFYPTI